MSELSQRCVGCDKVANSKQDICAECFLIVVELRVLFEDQSLRQIVDRLKEGRSG